MGRAQNLKPWPKGVSGNPGGRPKKPPLTDALQRLLEDPREAEGLIKAAVRMARRDSGFLKAIWERAEGKVPKPVEVSGDVTVGLAERIEAGRKRLADIRKRAADADEWCKREGGQGRVSASEQDDKRP